MDLSCMVLVPQGSISIFVFLFFCPSGLSFFRLVCKTHNTHQLPVAHNHLFISVGVNMQNHIRMRNVE